LRRWRQLQHDHGQRSRRSKKKSQLSKAQFITQGDGNLRRGQHCDRLGKRIGRRIDEPDEPRPPTCTSAWWKASSASVDRARRPATPNSWVAAEKTGRRSRAKSKKASEAEDVATLENRLPGRPSPAVEEFQSEAARLRPLKICSEGPHAPEAAPESSAGTEEVAPEESGGIESRTRRSGPGRRNSSPKKKSPRKKKKWPPKTGGAGGENRRSAGRSGPPKTGSEFRRHRPPASRVR